MKASSSVGGHRRRAVARRQTRPSRAQLVLFRALFSAGNGSPISGTDPRWTSIDEHERLHLSVSLTPLRNPVILVQP